MYTTNGGTSWTSQTTGVTEALAALHFPALDTGYVCGQAGRIIKTVDGGTTWIPQTNPSGADLFSIHFTSTNTGHAVGDSGVVLKTTDGGSNWTKQYLTGNMLMDVYFVDAQSGVIVGDSGVIFITIDGGVNWTSENSPTTERLKAVYFPDITTGYAVGDNGIVLKADSVITGYPKIQRASTISIYPNPANGYIYIRGLSGSFQIRVLDFLGRTVHSESINNISEPIDLSNLHDGLYLLEFSYLDRKEYKKFIINN